MIYFPGVTPNLYQLIRRIKEYHYIIYTKAIKIDFHFDLVTQ